MRLKFRRTKRTNPPSAPEPAPSKEKQRQRTRRTRSTPKKQEPGPFDNLPAWKLWLVGVSALFVVVLITIIGLVVIGTQVGFYEKSLDTRKVETLKNLDLALFTPIATEGIVWAFTMMAITLAVMGKTNRLWTYSMWGSAGIAAFVNANHAIEQGDLLGGLVTGGLSLALPAVVHAFILWIKHLLHGATIVEAKRSSEFRWQAIGNAALTIMGVVADHITHPVIAVKAFRIWRGIREYSYSQSWGLAATAYRRQLSQKLREDAYGNTSGSKGSRSKKGRFRKKSVNEVDLASSVHTTSAQGVQHTAAHPVQDGGVQGVHTPDEGVQHNAAQGVHGVQGDDPEELHTLEHVHSLDDLIDLWGLHTPDSTAETPDAHPVQDGGVQGVHTPDEGVQHNAAQGVHDEDAQPRAQGVQHNAAQHNDRARTPRNKRARSRAQGVQRDDAQVHTPPRTGAKNQAAHHYWRVWHTQGIDASTLNQSEVAKMLDINRSAVNRGFQAAQNGEYPDPGPSAFTDERPSAS